MNALELINFGASELRRKKIGTSRLDSELLLSKILNKNREEILINLEQKICQKYFLKYKQLIQRRSQCEPIAYIVKEKEFWSKNFFVSPDTLIPRPETEIMVEKLVKIFKEKKISILDMGTGSGCILISLLSELNTSDGVGIGAGMGMGFMLPQMLAGAMQGGQQQGGGGQQGPSPMDKLKKLKELLAFAMMYAFQLNLKPNLD